MPGRFLSSKLRFRQYKRDLRAGNTDGSRKGGPRRPHTDGTQPPDRERQRSFFQLLREFWRLLDDYHGRIVFALGTLTISTFLSLVPPYATKIVVDNILGGRPLPPGLVERFNVPTDRQTLLLLVAIGIVVLTACSIAIGMLGRWQATKTSVQVKPAIRRKLFD